MLSLLGVENPLHCLGPRANQHRILEVPGLEFTTKICFSFGKVCVKFTFPNTKTLFRINFCHYKFRHCLESLQIPTGFCSAESATFLILKIGWIEVTLWHFSFGELQLKFSFFHLNFYLSRKSGKSVNPSPECTVEMRFIWGNAILLRSMA